MDRRRLVLAGAAALAASPVLAQGAAQPIPVDPQPAAREPNPGLRGGGNGVTPEQQRRLQMQGAPQDTGTGGQAAAPQGQAGAQQAGAQYVRDTLAAGTVSLQQTTFARTKAQDPRVKQFAEFEEAEQNELTEVLHSLSDPGATASTAAAAASTAPVLSDEAAQVMERFSRAQPGPGFDREYVAAQIAGHRNLLAVQDRFLKSNPASREMAGIARLARGRIQEHLARLEALQQELGR